MNAIRERRPAARPWVLVGMTLVLFLGAAAGMAKKQKKPKVKKGSSAEHAEIEGVVRSADDDKKMLAGITVRVATPDGPVEAVSADDGTFALIIPKAAGTYTISLAGDGYAPFEAEVPLEAGQRYSYDFKLVDATAGLRQAATQAYNDGAKLYQEGDIAGAKAKFEAALEAAPDLAQIQVGLANVYLSEGDLDAAREAIETFRATDPAEPNAARLAFEIYMRQGDLDRMTSMIETFSGGPEANNLAAQIYNDGVAAMRDNDYDRAIALFDIANGIAPTLAEPLTGKATLQYNTEDYAGLEATLAQLMEAAPDHPRAHRLRFLLHDARQQTEDAMAAFDAYHAVDSAAAIDLLYKRADLDFRESRPEDAKASLERILVLEPDHAQAHYTLGLALASLGENAGAREHLQRFIELAPDDPEVATVREMLPHLGG